MAGVYELLAGGDLEPVTARYDAQKRTLTIDVGSADTMVFQGQQAGR